MTHNDESELVTPVSEFRHDGPLWARIVLATQAAVVWMLIIVIAAIMLLAFGTIFGLIVIGILHAGGFWATPPNTLQAGFPYPYPVVGLITATGGVAVLVSSAKVTSAAKAAIDQEQQ